MPPANGRSATRPSSRTSSCPAGEGRPLAEEVERRMKGAADNLNFELATELRDRLFEIREMAGLKGKAVRSSKK